MISELYTMEQKGKPVNGTRIKANGVDRTLSLFCGLGKHSFLVKQGEWHYFLYMQLDFCYYFYWSSSVFFSLCFSRVCIKKQCISFFFTIKANMDCLKRKQYTFYHILSAFCFIFFQIKLYTVYFHHTHCLCHC